MMPVRKKLAFAMGALSLGWGAGPGCGVLHGQNSAASGNFNSTGCNATPAKPSSGATPGGTSGSVNLGDLDLNDLMNVQVVTSASKKAECLSGAPAAIFVITGAEMQRNGFANLPEALRTVPGLYVAQTDSHIWQISTRGFSDLANNKMLVLVDGRSVYSPDEGTVYWDVLDLPIENIDRVEVIRGPGGTLWGDNAVNGVINIVTKSSKQMQGAMVSTSADPETGYTSTVRYGGEIGSSVSYSAYGRASYWEPFQLTTGGAGPDHFGLTQGGARLDWAPAKDNDVTLQGGSYDGRFGSSSFTTGATTTYLLKGNNILAHWKGTLTDKTSIDTLGYCDWFTRLGAPAEERNTCDVEFQQNHQFNSRNSLILGGSFFTTGDNLTVDQVLYFREKFRDNIYSGFGQYEVVLIPNRLRLLGGIKMEHNGYTGFEFAPQGRAVWTPTNSSSAWVGVSKSNRTPARNNSDIDAHIPTGVSNGLPVISFLEGSMTLQSEHVFSYEAGYRWQRGETLSFDAAIYYNQYDGLIVQTLQSIQVLPTGTLKTILYINGPGAQTHGLEVSAHWVPVHHWTLTAAANEVRGSPIAVQATSQHIYNLQSRVELPFHLEVNATGYYYAQLGPGSSGAFAPVQSIPVYSRFDFGGVWRPRTEWSFGVWGRNLQSSSHVETRSTAYRNANEDVPRSVMIQAMWRSAR